MKKETYAWCACGRSMSQPFCDGSYPGTGLEPVAFEAKEDGEAFLCLCKHAGNEPYCDGTHARLPKADAAPAAAPRIFRDNISVPTIPALARARRHLDAKRRDDVTLVITG